MNRIPSAGYTNYPAKIKLLLAATKHESNVALVRDVLDVAAFKAAWEDGRSLSMDQSIAYALEAT